MRVWWLSAGLALYCLAQSAAAGTLLVVGDSISAGFGLDSRQGWVSLLQTRLEKEGFDAKVVNASISGDTSAGGQARLPALLAAHKPSLVVLELGGLEDRPSLLVAVMFSLIIYIENRMYRTPRNLKKLNVIDEGWRLLDFKNRKVGEFIEKGYRTARRHTGAYITITQNIVDFDSDKASSAARAEWGNSSYKIILKQSAKEFAKYNQLFPDQFQPLQRDMIGKFGAAKDQWFSSFLLQVENHSSWHRLFVDPLSRAMYSSDGPDFEFVQQKRKEGLSIHEAVWQLAWKKSGPEMASLEAWLEEHEKYRSVA